MSSLTLTLLGRILFDQLMYVRPIFDHALLQSECLQRMIPVLELTLLGHNMFALHLRQKTKYGRNRLSKRFFAISFPAYLRNTSSCCCCSSRKRCVAATNCSSI